MTLPSCHLLRLGGAVKKSMKCVFRQTSFHITSYPSFLHTIIHFFTIDVKIQNLLHNFYKKMRNLKIFKQIKHLFVGVQKKWCDFAIVTCPVEQYFLVFFIEIIGSIGFEDILFDTTGGITKKETLELLSFRGFFYYFVFESYCVQVEVSKRQAENIFVSFTTGFGYSCDSFCYSSHS